VDRETERGKHRCERDTSIDG
uniref:Uncharacterized protein n=1 Tax=Myotis lucifugus TaxID=59463 RepID=G1Q3D5_MYOLU